MIYGGTMIENGISNPINVLICSICIATLKVLNRRLKRSQNA
jgi:hypothetical protein